MILVNIRGSFDAQITFNETNVVSIDKKNPLFIVSSNNYHGRTASYPDVRQAKLVISSKVKILVWRNIRTDFVRSNSPPVSSAASPAERC